MFGNIYFKQLEELKAKGVRIDMTRGKPSLAQLQIALPMLDAKGMDFSYDGGDARNYGDLKGLPAARALFADILEVDAKNVIVIDSSSLSVMYDLVSFAMQFGVMGGKPWGKLPRVKFLCPSPGYDRHFAICGAFGIEMIPVGMTPDGPDMDKVERIASSSEEVKGMWCVPKYSNPTGAVYSDKVVRRIARLKPKAKDFRVFWDNAYAIHSLYGEDKLLNIFDELEEGNEDMVYELTSTSKITFAGSGIAALATSEKNVEDILSKLRFRIISPNKVNQLLHVNFLKDKAHTLEIMRMHADILRPKFELVLAKLDAAFKGDERVRWSMPCGGYFISLDVKGKAKRVVELAAYAGVKFTAAGATYPYGVDPEDSNIRIAPSVPSVKELDLATDVLVAAIRAALSEKE